ncbi:uncharacterized protein CTHT_0072250 [Thermochaetoides thermophila DSM 1495]|uniref:DUF8021 domain-containing protein n=1 Tax=Chaetomium thermophilum (strain DSM 1495 / CBS 144.50 / IMI 039719) TaxID=759272 RepID=G0SFV3_CHATD|nr:hypothetical protein CTHT_0072250 [Thermochaetoides thermophila DSM 1495]EGS17868.1 hypothetical protein CTHT_0072250 [Thermochaetoides thermophila DSM 1495]
MITFFLPVASAQRDHFPGAPACAWEGTRQATDAFIEALLAPSETIDFLSTFPLFTASPNFKYIENGKHIAFLGEESLIHAWPNEVADTLQDAYVHSIVDEQDRCTGFVKIIVPLGRGKTGGEGEDMESVQATNATARSYLAVGAYLEYSYDETRPGLEAVLAEEINLVYARLQPASSTKLPDNADAENLLQIMKKEPWGVVGTPEQDNVQHLQAVAERYLNIVGGEENFQDSTDVQAVSEDDSGEELWGKPCSRLEGTVLTVPGETERCGKGLQLPPAGEGKGITDRKWTVDEALGAVGVVAKDENKGGISTVIELRVEGGKLRYVHQFWASER